VTKDKNIPIRSWGKSPSFYCKHEHWMNRHSV